MTECTVISKHLTDTSTYPRLDDEIEPTSELGGHELMNRAMEDECLRFCTGTSKTLGDETTYLNGQSHVGDLVMLVT